jgi:bacterioferritin
MLAGSFTADIAAIRERARQRMEEGPVTGSYGRDPKEVIAVLNDDVVATGIVCRMRYTRHAISAAGINRAQVAGEFTEHAESERGQAMRAAERISQLGSEPAFGPAAIADRSHTTYETYRDEDLEGMLRGNLVDLLGA